VCLEATEELSLDSPPISEVNDVNHHNEDVLPAAVAEPVDVQNHESGASEPPKLSVLESVVSAPVPKSQSVPEVTSAAAQRLGAKVDYNLCDVACFAIVKTFLVCLNCHVCPTVDKNYIVDLGDQLDKIKTKTKSMTIASNQD